MSDSSATSARFLFGLDQETSERLDIDQVLAMLDKATWSYFRTTYEWEIFDDKAESLISAIDCDLAFVPKDWAEFKTQSCPVHFIANYETLTIDTFLSVIQARIHPRLLSAGDTADLVENYYDFFTNMTVLQVPGGLSTRDWLLQKEGIEIDDKPVNLQHAMHPARKNPTAVTSAEHPFSLVYTNRRFKEVTEYDNDTPYSTSLGFLQGPSTSRKDVDRLMTSLQAAEQSADVTLVNYTRSLKSFKNRVRVSPVGSGTSSAARLPYLVSVMDIIRECEPGELDCHKLQRSEAARACKRLKSERDTPEVCPTSTPTENMPINPVPVVDSKSSDEAIIVTLAKYPFTIVHVNHAWEELCHYKADEVVGLQCSILQGPLTDKAAVKDVCDKLMAGDGSPQVLRIKNYKKNDSKHFLNELTLTREKESEYVVGRLREIFIVPCLTECHLIIE